MDANKRDIGRATAESPDTARARRILELLLHDAGAALAVRLRHGATWSSGAARRATPWCCTSRACYAN